MQRKLNPYFKYSIIFATLVPLGIFIISFIFHFFDALFHSNPNISVDFIDIILAANVTTLSYWPLWFLVSVILTIFTIYKKAKTLNRDIFIKIIANIISSVIIYFLVSIITLIILASGGFGPPS